MKRRYGSRAPNTTVMRSSDHFLPHQLDKLCPGLPASQPSTTIGGATPSPLNRRRTVFAPPSLRMASRHEARQPSYSLGGTEGSNPVPSSGESRANIKRSASADEQARRALRGRRWHDACLGRSHQRYRRRACRPGSMPYRKEPLLGPAVGELTPNQAGSNFCTTATP